MKVCPSSAQKQNNQNMESPFTLRTPRMVKAGCREIPRGTAELHQHRGLMDHLAGFAANDMNAQNAIGPRIRENFHKPFSGLIDLGTAVGGKRELADGIGHA